MGLATAPNQKWIADFTCIWTAEGWLYVAAVTDLFSRRVVGGAGRKVPSATPMEGRRRLVDERHDGRSVGRGRVDDGDLAPRQTGHAAASLGPGKPIQQ